MKIMKEAILGIIISIFISWFFFWAIFKKHIDFGMLKMLGALVILFGLMVVLGLMTFVPNAWGRL